MRFQGAINRIINISWMKSSATAIGISIGIVLLLTGIFFLSTGWEGNPPLHPSITLDGVSYPADISESFFVIPFPADKNGGPLTEWAPVLRYQTKKKATLFVSGTPLANGSNISIPAGTRSLALEFHSGNTVEKRTLYFTCLPVICLTADVLDPHKKHMATMTLYESGLSHSIPPDPIPIKLKERGKSALRDPKRPLRINIFRQSLSLLGMRTDDDWILDALWTDASYIRNRLVFDLFADMQQSTEKIGSAAPAGRAVEVFLNNRYHGLFFLMEPVDRKLLNLDAHGLIYKAYCKPLCDFNNSGPQRTDMAPEAGYVIKYPKSFRDTHFNDLRKLVRFIANTDQTTFDTEIHQWIDVDNFIDHTLLMWAGACLDSLAHNYYLVKNPNSPMFIIPWDNERSFGCLKEGRHTPPGLNLWPYANRMEMLLLSSPRYWPDITQRWKQLRKGLFSDASLHERTTCYQHLLESSGAVERDCRRWERNVHPITEEFDYMRAFITKRMAILDKRFSSETPFKDKFVTAHLDT